jgi:hypothetical protein
VFESWNTLSNTLANEDRLGAGKLTPGLTGRPAAGIRQVHEGALPIGRLPWQRQVALMACAAQPTPSA